MVNFIFDKFLGHFRQLEKSRCRLSPRKRGNQLQLQGINLLIIVNLRVSNAAKKNIKNNFSEVG